MDDHTRVYGVRIARRIKRKRIRLAGSSADSLLADEEIDGSHGDRRRMDNARAQRVPAAQQAHAKRRLRIVDHHLVFADRVALPVVAHHADAQPPDVIPDLHRHDHRPALGLRQLHAVDKQLHALDGRRGDHRHVEIAVDETLGLLRDTDGLSLKCGREENNDER